MVKKSNDNLCPLCGMFMLAVCSGFRYTPFIDGKTYQYICDCCRNVPKTNELVGDKWVSYEYGDKLRTLEEMMEDGWSKDEAKQSVKAVKSVMKNKKI